jgi:hypothetical protein
MSNEKEKALDKIKKLLRMKRGGTPEEIETALALAAEIARKNGINIDAVDPDAEPATPIGHIDAVTSARIQWECKYAGLVCQQFFNVNCLLRQKVRTSSGWYFAFDHILTFIGIDRDIQIALYVYHFLVRHFRYCWKTGSGRCRNRQAFMYGMYIGLCAKLGEQRRQQVNEAGIILLDRQVALRKAYTQSTFGATESYNAEPDGDAEAAKYAGYAAGRATEIRSGIGRSGQATLLLS